MMILFAAVIASMMLLCIASAAGLFPTAQSRKAYQWFLNKKPGKLLLLLRQGMKKEKHKTA